MFTKVFVFQKLVKHCQQKELSNPKDKIHCLCKKNECIVGHLPLGKTGNFAETIFYFLRADNYNIGEVEILERQSI